MASLKFLIDRYAFPLTSERCVTESIGYSRNFIIKMMKNEIFKLRMIDVSTRETSFISVSLPLFQELYK